jgi:hypothetical protein
MTSRQLKNPYGFFAPYIPIPKGRGFTARLVKKSKNYLDFLLFSAILNLYIP